MRISINMKIFKMKKLGWGVIQENIVLFIYIYIYISASISCIRPDYVADATVISTDDGENMFICCKTWRDYLAFFSSQVMTARMNSCVTLSLDDYENYKEETTRALQNAMKCTIGTRENMALSNGYRIVHDKLGYKVFARHCEKSAFHEHICVGKMHTSLEELQYALYAESTDEHRMNLAAMYDTDFCDGAILNETKCRNMKDPFEWFGVKYMKMNLRYHVLFEPREATYIEVTFITNIPSKYQGKNLISCIQHNM